MVVSSPARTSVPLKIIGFTAKILRKKVSPLQFKFRSSILCDVTQFVSQCGQTNIAMTAFDLASSASTKRDLVGVPDTSLSLLGLIERTGQTGLTARLCGPF
ncbi:hypothetical protein TNCV_288411 [Trichonephila clavipes]|nr:hypothetical protein TNCV_288411 [Trichonephila clavipes]